MKNEILLDEIKELIPHRDPFLFLDKLFNIEKLTSATGYKLFTDNEPFFEGHFPDRPVMPGVLIIESMAQTAGCLVVATLGQGAEGKLVYFMTIENARFRKPVTPGDQLIIAVEKLRSRGNVFKFSGKAHVNDGLVAEASFSAMIVDK